MKMKNKYKQRLFWIIVLAIFWQLIALSGLFSEMIFPGLDKITLALIKSLRDGSLIRQIYFSISIIMQGLFFSTAAALILVWSLADSDFKSFSSINFSSLFFSEILLSIFIE